MTSYSTRSWWGPVFIALVGIPRVIDLVLGGSSVWDLGVLAFLMVGLGLCLLSRVVVTAEGIERRPGTVRIPWNDIVRFEALPRDDRVRSIRVIRTKGRRIALTPYWLNPAQGAALLERLNEARASRTAS